MRTPETEYSAREFIKYRKENGKLYKLIYSWSEDELRLSLLNKEQIKESV